MEIIFEAIGWVGALILLFAFYMNITQRYTPESVAYLTLNFTGSVLLTINAWHYHSYPFVVVNITWMVFSGYQLIGKRQGK